MSARNSLLAAARSLVPGGNADAIGGAESPDELLEAGVVEAAHEAGMKPMRGAVSRIVALTSER